MAARGSSCTSLPTHLPPLPHPASGWCRKKMSLAGPPHHSPGQSQRQNVLKDHLFQEDFLHPCPWQPWGQALAPGGCARSLKQDLEGGRLCSGIASWGAPHRHPSQPHPHRPAPGGMYVNKPPWAATTCGLLLSGPVGSLAVFVTSVSVWLHLTKAEEVGVCVCERQKERVCMKPAVGLPDLPHFPNTNDKKVN